MQTKQYATLKIVLGVAVVVAATVAAYVPALRGGFLWDDDDHVTANRAVQSPDGLARIWFDIGATPQYYPLVFTSFWVEYAIWGARPFGYHLANVLLHALNAVLLWLVLRRLSVPGAWFAAAIFLLHPVQVETVAWITERKNLLSSAFYLGSLLTYLQFADMDVRRSGAARRWGFHALAMVLFLGALSSKTVACSLPAVLLLLVWWKRGRVTMSTVLPLVPMFAIGIAMGLLTIWIESYQIGAQGAEWELSPIERGLIAGRAVWFYLGKLVWPAGLCFVYPRWEIDAGQWWQYLYPSALLALIVGLWLARDRIGRAFLVVALVFVGTLVPALGFFDVYPMRFSFVADHFQYLACAAPIALAVALLARGAAAFKPGTLLVLAQRGAAVALLALLATLTWQRGHAFRDLETLWRDTLAKNPDAWLAHLNLGGLLEAQGEFQEAESHWNEVIRLGPDAHKAQTNLGLMYEARLGQPQVAIEHYREAIGLNDSAPEALNNLAWLLATHPDPAVRDGPEAVRLAERAARLTGYRHGSVLDTLAAAYAEAGRFEDAIRTVRSALRQLEGMPDPALRRELTAHLEYYQAQHPYREQR